MFEPRVASPQLSLQLAAEGPNDWVVRESARARRLSVKVFRTGRVEVIVPRRVSARTVSRFVEQHREWIDQKRTEALRNAVPPQPFPPARIELSACAESWRVHLVTQASFYVLLSRARSTAHLFTDDRAHLAEAVAGRSGQQPTALERQRRQHARRGWQVVSSLDRLMAGTGDRLQSLADRLRATMARVSARRIQLAHRAAHQRLQTPDPSLLARQRQR